MSESGASQIVPFEPSHLDAVLALTLRAWQPVFASIEATMLPAAFRAFYPDGWEASQRAAVEAICRDPDTPVWVAIVDEAVSGFVGIKTHEESSMGEIYIIAVDPAQQRRGVASTLIAFAFDWMREEGLEIAMVETGHDEGHAPARQAYEKVGFALWPVARYFRAL